MGAPVDARNVAQVWASRCQYAIRASTGPPASARRSRPLRKVSSMKKRKTPTSPCCFRTSCAAPQAVPPVARRSSTIATFSPARTESTCASSTPLPYSSAYSTRSVLYGSFPSLRTGDKPIFSRSARAAPKTNPRDSMATMRSKPRPRSRSSMSSSTVCNAFGSPSTGVMSLKRMPGWGKSGTSRISARTCTREPICRILEKNRPPVPWGGWDRRPRDRPKPEARSLCSNAPRRRQAKASTQKTERVPGLGADADLEVQVRPRGVACFSHPGDLLSSRHLVALRDQVLGVVGVDGHHVAVVREQHEVPVSALLSREEHDPVVGGAHRRALRTGEIDPIVVIALPLAESGDEHTRRGPGEGLTQRSGV